MLLGGEVQQVHPPASGLAEHYAGGVELIVGEQIDGPGDALHPHHGFQLWRQADLDRAGKVHAPLLADSQLELDRLTEKAFSSVEDLPWSKWGLIPDMAISTTLRGIIAPDRVKELAFLADVFGAEEAARIGAVTRICDDPLGAARDTAAAIAERSPDAIRGVKRLVNEAWGLAEADCLALEAAIQVRILGGPNQAEAVRANIEKRRPEFAD